VADYEGYSNLWEEVLTRFNGLQMLNVRLQYKCQLVYYSSDLETPVGLMRMLGYGRQQDHLDWRLLLQGLEENLCGPVDKFVARGGRNLRALRLVVPNELASPLFRLAREGYKGWEERKIMYVNELKRENLGLPTHVLFRKVNCLREDGVGVKMKDEAGPESFAEMHEGLDGYFLCSCPEGGSDF